MSATVTLVTWAEDAKKAHRLFPGKIAEHDELWLNRPNAAGLSQVRTSNGSPIVFRPGQPIALRVGPESMFSDLKGLASTQVPRDPDKTAPPDGRPALTPEERIKVEATRCGAHEVWKQQLPAAPNTGPYGALVGWDWAERNTVTNRWGKVVTQDMLTATVGVSGILPTGSVLIYWGLNAWVSPQPASPWAG
jgi:hypothetical protein